MATTTDTAEDVLAWVDLLQGYQMDLIDELAPPARVAEKFVRGALGKMFAPLNVYVAYQQEDNPELKTIDRAIVKVAGTMLVAGVATAVIVSLPFSLAGSTVALGVGVTMWTFGWDEKVGEYAVLVYDETVGYVQHVSNTIIKTIMGENPEFARLLAGNVDQQISSWAAKVQMGRLPANTPFKMWCFQSETPVLMADGTFKPIREVCVGDMVTSFDMAGDLCVRRVTELFRGQTYEFVELNNGVRVTPGHEFLTAHGEFKPISRIIEQGEQVVSIDGSFGKVTGRLINALMDGGSISWR